MMCDGRLFGRQIAGLRGLAEASVGDLTRDDTIGGMAARVLAAAPPRFALAGLSMGGIVAMEVLRRAPGRVERVALMDTNHRAETPERRASREAQIARVRERGLEAVFVEEIRPHYLAPGNRADAELSRLLLAMALDL